MYSNDSHGCPRGFKWCDKKQECIPEGTQVADRLEQRYQRYFFKEEITMDDIDKLVDEVFDGGFSHFGRVRKSERKIDQILDSLETGRPYDHPLKMRVTTTLDGKSEVDVDECNDPLLDGNEKEFEGSDVDGGEIPAKEENPQKHTNDINHVPNQNAAALTKSIHDELTEEVILRVIENTKNSQAYKNFVAKALIEFEYSSKMPIDKKLILFNALDEAWRIVEQIKNPSGPHKQWGGGGFIRGSDRRGGFGSIAGTTRMGGFGSIKGKPQEQEDLDDEIDDVEESPTKE